MSTQPYPTPTSPLYPLACDFIRACNALDFLASEAMLAPVGFTNQIWPSSLQDPEHKQRLDKEQFIAMSKQELGKGKIFKELNVSPSSNEVLSRTERRYPVTDDSLDPADGH